tara:strand:- start:400 stop:981 length:582 start_codon:yes stop_codon:yes gene_type:complete
MNDLDQERTLPPTRTLRFGQAIDLFNRIPEISNFISLSPGDNEDCQGFIETLRYSKTPEDAIIFMSFAIERRLSIQWGLEAVLDLSPNLPPDETQLINWVSEWIDSPTSQTRWKTLQVALFAPRQSAAVHLGLAVGWSDGPIAPNDLVTVPKWRTPYAISTAILGSIGQRQPHFRADDIKQVLDKGATFLRRT